MWTTLAYQLIANCTTENLFYKVFVLTAAHLILQPIHEQIKKFKDIFLFIDISRSAFFIFDHVAKVLGICIFLLAQVEVSEKILK